jgi:hypothetical protein
MSDNTAQVTELLPPPALEKHYTPEALGGLWGLSPDTVRRMIEREPGVLVVTNERRGARRYRTFRIPESVALRLHHRLSNPVAFRNG